MLIEGTKVMWDFSEVTIVCRGEPYSCVEDKFGKKHIVLTQKLEEPKTIRIGEYEVPLPLREAPPEGTKCYMPNILDLDNTFTYYTEFEASNRRHRLGLLKGNLHLTKEAAQLHAKALLSFTTTEQPSETNK